MADLVPFLDALSVQQRLLASAGVVLGLVLVLVGLKRLALRIGDRSDTFLGEAGAGALSLLLAGGAGVALIWLWNASPVVESGVLRIERPYVLAARGFVSAVVVVSLYALTGLVRHGVTKLAESEGGVGRHESEIAYRIVQVFTYGVGLLVILGIWDVDLGGLLIGAGFLGIVVGLAARQTLGALIAGFVLMFSRPFEIGDWVEVGDEEGIVTDITIVNTRLQTFDGEYVMLPNDVVASNEVVNRTRKGRLRIHVEVGVDYETDLETAVEVAEAAMDDRDEVLSTPAPEAVLAEFGASAMVLDLRFWIDTPSASRRWDAQTAVVAAVKRAFDEREIKIPYPQRELTGRREAGGFRVTGEPPGAARDGERRESDADGNSGSETEAEAGSSAEPGAGADDD
jgi:small-conductance mechanosensitive channel